MDVTDTPPEAPQALGEQARRRAGDESPSTPQALTGAPTCSGCVLPGQVFGKLTVLEVGGHLGRGRVRLRCECGTEVMSTRGLLRQGWPWQCDACRNMAKRKRPGTEEYRKAARLYDIAQRLELSPLHVQRYLEDRMTVSPTIRNIFDSVALQKSLF